MNRKILVVDDTLNIQTMLSDFLTSQNFEVFTASDGMEALQLVRQHNPDLVLLDIMMPNMDGYQFINHLRHESSTPVIMITAKQQENDVVRGFDCGADDYITKPFKLRELLVRMRAVMRRSLAPGSSDPSFSVGDVTLDPSHHEVQQAGQLVEVTPLEFTVLEILMRSAGRVVRRSDLCISLIDHGYTGSEATLKIHIRNLRQKLGDDLAQPRYIETVFGVGYRFIEEVA